MIDELCGADDSETRPEKNLKDLQGTFKVTIDVLQQHREVIGQKIIELEKQNKKTALKYQESLKEPEKLLNVS